MFAFSEWHRDDIQERKIIMNINAIANSTHGISLYDKKKDEKGTSFLDVLNQNVREAYEKQKAESAEAARIAAELLSGSISDCPLTDEQLDYLASKYDIDNIQPMSQEERDFLNELADMGIIPREQALPAFLNVGIIIADIDDPSVAQIISVEEAPSRVFDLCTNRPASDSMIDRLMAIIENQKNISEYYRSTGKTRASEISDRHVSSKQTILSVLHSLAARKAQSSGNN